MADDALLSDLCSICNTAKFKYRCPGCSARTCSLPCYKRHQQWAQCNGKRDPTKFVKKSQLATPAGIDHDFNFLTSIERGLEKAERQVQTHSAGNPSDPRHDANIRQPSDQHFAMAGVTVIRAPKGLSRQKENKTHRNKSGKNTVWTVEWIHEDSTRVLTQTSSAQSLLSSQPFGRDAKREATKKRKRSDNQPPANAEPVEQNVSPAVQVQEGASETEAQHTQPDSPSLNRVEPERSDLSAIAKNSTASDAASTKNDEEQIPKNSGGSIHVHGSEPKSVYPQYSFYLVRPRTSSNRPVLILLEPTATLGDCLRGRTVLEYPTIYVYPVLTLPPPEKFMLEAEYLQQEGEEQKEFEDLLKHVSPETLRALKDDQDAKDNNASEAIDGNKILDVLKQDIGAGI